MSAIPLGSKFDNPKISAISINLIQWIWDLSHYIECNVSKHLCMLFFNERSCIKCN